MKTIINSIFLIFCTLFFSDNVFSQCNYAQGSNGAAISLLTPITIDGNMNDWLPYLSNPNNNSYDQISGTDLDAPIADAGRNLSRFTFTEDANNLYMFIERVGSTNNKVDILFYADINNNDIMELNEPVIHIDWGGSNENVNISSYSYIPSVTSSLNSISNNLDGSALWGTLDFRNNIGQTAQGQGSVDGKSMEMKIPFMYFTTLGVTGNIIKQLAFGQDFKFHISTINGNISSIPNSNSINDNFGGCLRVPIANGVLPVKLSAFSATLFNNKAELNWKTSSEENLNYFVIEKSFDGINFSDAGMVFAFGNASTENKYSMNDNLITANSPVVYYRLRSVDNDGKTQLSETRMLRLTKQNQSNISILTYPNPVTNELRITIPSAWQNKAVTYEIVSLTGQIVSKTVRTAAGQTENTNISKLESGFYMVKATCEGQVATQKIVKQ